MLNRLKSRRDKLGYTQNQVSDRARIAARSYQNYETDKRVPKVDVALKIAEALNTTVEELWSTAANKNNNN